MNVKSDMQFYNKRTVIKNYVNNLRENLLQLKWRYEYEKIYALLRDWQHEKRKKLFSKNFNCIFWGVLKE